MTTCSTRLGQAAQIIDMAAGERAHATLRTDDPQAGDLVVEHADGLGVAAVIGAPGRQALSMLELQEIEDASP